MFLAPRWRLLAAGIVCVAAAGSPPAPSPDAGAGGHPSELPAPRVLGGGPGGVPSEMADSGVGPASSDPQPGGRVSLGQRWRGWCLRCKCRLQHCFLGYPEYFEEVPLGASLYAQGRTLVANGEAAGMVFYNYDFVEGRAELNLHGRDRLVRITRLLATNPAPVVIERLPCAPELAEARRLVVLNELAQGPCPVPPERVVIGAPPAPGLSGPEAELIYRNLLLQVQSAGSRPTLGVGTTGMGAFGVPAGGFGVGGFGGMVPVR